MSGRAVVIEVLGPIRAWRDGAELDLGPAGRRAVLGLLTLAGGQPMARGELVDALWGDRPPPTATNVLQTHVKHLRRLFEPDRRPHGPSRALPNVGDGYALRLSDVDVDLARFRELVTSGDTLRACDQRGAAVRYGEALRLWRGEPLADLPALAGHPKILALTGERRAAMARYGETMIAAGLPADAIPLLAEAAAAQPLDEAAQTCLIRAYHAAGQRAQAFATYHTTRRLLADELGVSPGPELTAAYRILLGEPGPSPAEPARSGPSQLPAGVPGFAGRDRELSTLDALTGSTAVAVVSGTAGVGKTALAVHWAHRARARFPDGQLYVNLRGYDPDLPVSAGEALTRFLIALGVAGPDIPLDVDERATRFRAEIADRRMLVMLDNAATVEQVRPLLPGTPSAVVVATSRDQLAGLVALHGARRVDLDRLPTADANRLLRELIGARAAADPASTAQLAEQCARLPLALRVAAELAATRPDSPLAELVDELADRQRRLRLLDAGGDPRAAVRVVFSWSYHHLPADAATAFRRLGAHPGPDLDVHAAAALCDTDLDATRRALDTLTRAHLVERGGGRFALHDLLRAYSMEVEQTHDSAAIRAAALTRLLDHYRATAAAAMQTLHPAEKPHRPDVPPAARPGPPMVTAADARAWLDAERPVLTAVCAYAAAHGYAAHATQLSATLYRYLEGGYHTEALAMHTDALRAAQEAGDLSGQAHALTNLGAVYRLLGRYGPAVEHHERALALHRTVGDRYGEARTLSNLGIVDERQGRHDSAASYQERALALYRDLGDLYGEAAALTNLGNVYIQPGRYPRAADHLAQALKLWQEMGDSVGEAIARANLGEVCTLLGRYAPAAEHLTAALGLFRDFGHTYGEATVRSNLGRVHARLGRPETAIEHLREAVKLFRATGHRYGEASALNTLGETLYAAGRQRDALAQHRAALEIATETGDRDEEERARQGLASAAP